ncbi:hypothetical protein MP638_005000 [Amoeboaphelidium occidentale]|nr:hypothetical protein MP638_005000 [Amoeboaphelidium occidentale]
MRETTARRRSPQAANHPRKPAPLQNVPIAEEEEDREIQEETAISKNRKIIPEDLVKGVITKVLQERLAKETYVPELAPELCKSISSEILLELKALQYEHYKYAADVIVFETKGQVMRIASRPLSDPMRDVCTSAIFQNSSMVACGIVFASYFD